MLGSILDCIQRCHRILQVLGLDGYGYCGVSLASIIIDIGERIFPPLGEDKRDAIRQADVVVEDIEVGIGGSFS